MAEKLVIVGIGETSQDIRFFLERYQLFEVAGYAVNREYISGTQWNGLPVYALEELEQHIDKNRVVCSHLRISAFKQGETEGVHRT